MNGVVFDIEEFAVFDGPGIRCAVFLKGCPLRCAWCHNPEGLDAAPCRAVTRSLCARCGACDAVCPSPGRCAACGRCVDACPKGAVRIIGETMTPERVAARVGANAALLLANGGGVTFTGGEPMLQADFLLETRALLPGLHACVETSGYAPDETFRRVARAMDLVILDIKHTDPALHLRYTGVPNEQILRNALWLKASGIPFRARVPLIPDVNDTRENLAATAALLAGAKNLEKVELLRYNRAAGAKYAMLGLAYRPDFPEDKEPNAMTEPFTTLGMEATVL